MRSVAAASVCALLVAGGTAAHAAAPSVVQLQRQVRDLKRQRTFYAQRAEVMRAQRDNAREDLAVALGTVRDLENELQNATRPETVTVTTPATCPLPPRTAAEAYAQIRSLYNLFPTRGPYSASLYRSGSYESYSFTYSP